MTTVSLLAPSTHITAQEVMSHPVVVCRVNDPISRAFDIFQRGGLRHIVVCDARDHVVGIVDDRRLAREVGRLSWNELAEPLSELMDRAICRALPSDTLVQVARRLEFSPSEAVVVTSSDGRPIGLVTPADLVRLVAHGSPG